MSQTKGTVFLTEGRLQRQKSEPGQLKSWQSAQVGEPRGRRWDLRVGVRMDLTVMGRQGSIQVSDVPLKSVFDICSMVSLPQGCILTPTLTLFITEPQFPHLSVGVIRAHLEQVERMQRGRSVSHWTNDSSVVTVLSPGTLLIWALKEVKATKLHQSSGASLNTKSHL